MVPEAQSSKSVTMEGQLARNEVHSVLLASLIKVLQYIEVK